jgi:hypothetical protein
VGDSFLLGGIMIGPRQTAKLLLRAYDLRYNEDLTWKEIAKRLGVGYYWLMGHRPATDTKPDDLPDLLNSPDPLMRVQAMRDRRIRWKVIARQMGVDDWQTLAYALYKRQKDY